MKSAGLYNGFADNRTGDAKQMNSDPLHEAYSHFEAGQLQDADVSCQFILVDKPDNAEAWHLLGIIRFKQGRTEEALC